MKRFAMSDHCHVKNWHGEFLRHAHLQISTGVTLGGGSSRLYPLPLRDSVACNNPTGTQPESHHVDEMVSRQSDPESGVGLGYSLHILVCVLQVYFPTINEERRKQ